MEMAVPSVPPRVAQQLAHPCRPSDRRCQGTGGKGTDDRAALVISGSLICQEECLPDTLHTDSLCEDCQPFSKDILEVIKC